MQRLEDILSTPAAQLPHEGSTGPDYPDITDVGHIRPRRPLLAVWT